MFKIISIHSGTSTNGHLSTTATAIKIDTFLIVQSLKFLYHYESTPIQIYRKFHLQKLRNIRIKNSDIFYISAQNIDCKFGCLMSGPFGGLSISENKVVISDVALCVSCMRGLHGDLHVRQRSIHIALFLVCEWIQIWARFTIISQVKVDLIFVCLCWGFTAQSTRLGHVEHRQFT